jgi:hypothetical protein
MTCAPCLSGVLPQPLGQLVLGASCTTQSLSAQILELAMVEYLTNCPTVACWIGNRFYPRRVARKNKTWPVVTYYRSDTDHQHLLNSGAGWAIADISLDVWSPIYDDCLFAAEAIRNAMDGYSGSWGTIPIGSVILEADQDDEEDPRDGSGTFWFSRSQDYRIIFAESTPNF